MPPKTPRPRPPLSQAQEQTILDFVAWYSGQPDMSLARAADTLECSVGTLSAIINGNYPGDTAKYVRRMAERLAAVRADDAALREPPFMMLSAAEKIFSFCERCRSTRKMGFLCTQHGIGKTMALSAYADEHGISSVLISAFKNFTSKRLLLDLARRYGLDWHGSDAQMFRPIAAKLRVAGHPLVIVDEADFLGSARDTIRHLHDQAAVGVVLAGTPAFLEALRRRPSTTDGQFLSRVVYNLYIDKIVEEDGRRLADHFTLASAAWQRAWDLCGANARRLVNILMLATQFARGDKVAPDHVAGAAASLLPVEL